MSWQSPHAAGWGPRGGTPAARQVGKSLAVAGLKHCRVGTPGEGHWGQFDGGGHHSTGVAAARYGPVRPCPTGSAAGRQEQRRGRACTAAGWERRGGMPTA
eukprot:6605583-Alexandrium_andersonii.AAC.1